MLNILKNENIHILKITDNKTYSMTDEGALRLAAAILESAYSDYVHSLKRVMILWKKKCENKKFEKEWKNAIAQKEYDEKFYYSRQFQILTLGKSMPGNDVVKKIHKNINYFSSIYER